MRPPQLTRSGLHPEYSIRAHALGPRDSPLSFVEKSKVEQLQRRRGAELRLFASVAASNLLCVLVRWGLCAVVVVSYCLRTSSNFAVR